MEDFSRELFEAEGLQLKAPPALTLFDVYVDPVAKEFRPWKDIVKPFAYDPTASYFEMMVPTVDTTRFSSILSALITQVCYYLCCTYSENVYLRNQICCKTRLPLNTKRFCPTAALFQDNGSDG